MNMTRLTIYMMLTILVLMLVACEGSTDREWSVENRSSSAILVSATLQLNGDTVVKVIEKGERTIITIISHDKTVREPQVPYDVFSYFLVTNTSGDTMKKDWVSNKNWEIFIEETSKRPSHFQQTYDFIVTDQDF